MKLSMRCSILPLNVLSQPRKAGSSVSPVSIRPPGGFFGPIGIDASCRGRNVGKALLIRTLNAMKEYGYAYAVIGWVSSAEHFYRKTVGAEFIPGGNPENSIYSNKITL